MRARGGARLLHDVPGGEQGGFALLAVLLVLALLGVLGAEFAYSMRLEASAARTWRDGVIAAHLAEAGVEQAIREVSERTLMFSVLADDGRLVFYTQERALLPTPPREKVPLGSGQFTYRLTDEEGRLNLNTALPDRLDRLLLGLGVSKGDRDVIVDSVQDWRDANEDHRLNGAESEDYYLKLAVPYRSRNANIESPAELLQIRGVTPALYHGEGSRPGLVDLVTAKSPGPVNINTARPEVLRALGLSEAEIAEVIDTRRVAPYTAVPARFAGRGFAVASRTFRVEAEGLVDGQVRARLTAILQRRGTTGTEGVTVLDWSGVR